MHESAPLLQTLVVALALGAALLIVARRMRIPAVAPLLLCGVVVGPEILGWVDPRALGDAFEPLISIAVAIILFEGGLTLDMAGARAAPASIRRLVTVGAIITWLATAGLCMWLLGLDVQTSLLAGSLVIVTGPTVVTPLLRRIGVTERLHHVLHWEAVLIDPIGVFIALLCYEAIGVDSSVSGALVGLVVRTGSGTVIGLVAGAAFGYVLRKRWIPPEYVNIGILAGALLVYGVADRVLPHTGILAVTVAGFVVGWLKPPALADLKDFKLQITELAVALLLVILAADLELESFLALGLPGAIVVTLLILVVRPVVVAASTWGGNLNVRERLFMSWLAPRGIVAASMASLFSIELAHSGHEEATIIEPLTFSVIAATVILQGSTASFVARVLRVRRPQRSGWLIVGARKLGQQLAKSLQSHGVEVQLVDTNESVVAQAKAQGLRAFKANAVDVTLPEDPRLLGIGNLLGATDNDAVNQVVVAQWARELGWDHVHAWSDMCRGHALGQDVKRVADEQRLDQAKRVSLGLDSGELEVVKLEHEEVLAAGSRALFKLDKRGGSATRSKGDSSEGERIVLRWSRPNVGDLFQAVTTMPASVNTLVDGYEHVLAAAAARIPGLDMAHARSEIMQRHETISLNIGNGVVIPHALTPSVDSPICVVGVMPSCDDEAAEQRLGCKLIFLLLSPVDDANAHITALSTIARWARDPDRVQAVSDASTEEERLALLVGYCQRENRRDS